MRRAKRHATIQPAKIPRQAEIVDTSVRSQRDTREAAATPHVMPPRVPRVM